MGDRGQIVLRQNLGPTHSLLLCLNERPSISVGSGNRTVVLSVNVVAYLLPIPRMEQKYRDLYTFRSWLRDAFNGAVTISGEAVQVAVTSTTMGTDTYADQDYLTVSATAEVTVYETIAYTA